MIDNTQNINLDDIVTFLNGNESINLINNNIEGAIAPNAQFFIHPKEFPMFEMNKINFDINDKSVYYKYNDKGFRCDNFDSYESKNKIIFAGCSEGEGIGSNIEESWPYIIFNYLKNKNIVDNFYNLSVDNFGFQKIISNCLAYIDNFDSPDYIIILFPEITRQISWNKDTNSFYVEWNDVNQIHIEKNLISFLNSFINFITTMHIFEKYCIEKNIKLYWSIWSEKENYIFKKLECFKNFVPFDYSILNNSNLSKNKRDGHHGAYYHNLWANNIIQHIVKNLGV
jgi:hypothetical protein